MIDLIFGGTGPYAPKTEDVDILEYNPYSLTNKTNLLLIDNPSGVGYSYFSRP